MIPAAATSATLSFYVSIVTSETTTATAYDTLKVQLVDASTGSVLATLGTLSNLNKTGERDDLRAQELLRDDVQGKDREGPVRGNERLVARHVLPDRRRQPEVGRLTEPRRRVPLGTRGEGSDPFPRFRQRLRVFVIIEKRRAPFGTDEKAWKRRTTPSSGARTSTIASRDLRGHRAAARGVDEADDDVAGPDRRPGRDREVDETPDGAWSER